MYRQSKEENAVVRSQYIHKAPSVSPMGIFIGTLTRAIFNKRNDSHFD